MSKPAHFAATFVAMFAAHYLGDYWTQTNRQALDKGERGPTGVRACLGHVATYTAGSTLAVAGTSAALGMRLPWRAQLAAQLISAGTHYLFDRRWTAQKIYNAIDPLTGKNEFITAGGAPHMDQAWHLIWISVASLAAASLGGTP